MTRIRKPLKVFPRTWVFPVFYCPYRFTVVYEGMTRKEACRLAWKERDNYWLDMLFFGKEYDDMRTFEYSYFAL